MRAQSLTEVLLIVTLLSIGSIGMASLFGDQVRAVFGASASVLAGDREAQAPRAHRRPERKTMRTFGYDPAGGTNGPE